MYFLGSVVLLLYLNILHDVGCYEKNKGDVCKLGLDTFAWIQILIVIEVFLAFPFLFIYLGKFDVFSCNSSTNFDHRGHRGTMISVSTYICAHKTSVYFIFSCIDFALPIL